MKSPMRLPLALGLFLLSTASTGCGSPPKSSGLEKTEHVWVSEPEWHPEVTKIDFDPGKALVVGVVKKAGFRQKFLTTPEGKGSVERGEISWKAITRSSEYQAMEGASGRLPENAPHKLATLRWRLETADGKSVLISGSAVTSEDGAWSIALRPHGQTIKDGLARSGKSFSFRVAVPDMRGKFEDSAGVMITAFELINSL
jgi:hypothetical protein